MHSAPGIDPKDAARRITPQTKAAALVHLWGLPCKVAEWRERANAHGLALIEDASHAHGATVAGVPCGRFGDISVFSLQGDKIIPAGKPPRIASKGHFSSGRNPERLVFVLQSCKVNSY